MNGLARPGRLRPRGVSHPRPGDPRASYAILDARDSERRSCVAVAVAEQVEHALPTRASVEQMSRAYAPIIGGVEFDRFTVTWLVLRPDAPVLDEAASAALQDAHMAHLADLHEAGHLLAAGPLFDDEFRGLSILNVDPEQARALKEADPAVRAGRYSVKVVPWMVPAGAMTFSAAHFPRSAAELSGD